jgi:hypothetical protein
VTVVQRFGGALNLNVHVHALVFDGVHVMGADGRLRFQALPPPTPRERREWTETIVGLVTRLLRRQGLLGEDASGASAEEASVLDACQAASMRSVAALGPRSGRPLRKIVLSGLARDEGRSTHDGSGVGNGIDLDVGPVVRAAERKRLERACR